MRINIHYKITIIFCTILAVILFGIYFYLDSTLRDFTYKRIQSTLLKEALLTKLFLEEDFPETLRSKEMDEIADKTGKALDSRVTVISLEGKVLGDSELDGDWLEEVESHLYRPEVQKALRSGTGESSRFSTTVKKNMLYIATVFGKDKSRGIIRLSMPLSDIDMISSKLKKILLLSILIVFILAGIASFFASILIARPLKEMSVTADQIAKGDFSRKIHIASNDEVGDLAKDFNYMTEQISSKMDEVTANTAKLEAVLLSMFDGVMVIDAKGKILLMNQALKDFLMVKQGPVGKKPLEVLRNIEVQEIADAVLQLTGGAESREISILMPEEKILVVHGTPIVREGRVEGAVLVFHDITELRRLEKIRRDFVANVSHELRTPVSSIKGFAETLLGGALDDKENAGEFVKIIQANSDRLANLIDDLLDLSKLESGKIGLELRPCSVHNIVERVVSELEKQAGAKGIRIKNGVEKDFPHILADESMILHVFLNLMDNAIKYTNGGNGLVIISARVKDEFAEIDVADNGIGIPEKDLPRIFERFYCVDKARSRQLGGTGLGLSLVKHIVQEHGGQVFVKSVPGHGSTFTFTIPRA